LKETATKAVFLYQLFFVLSILKMARKKDYGSIDMELTDAQLRKLTKGGAIIVKPSMFKKGHMYHVSPTKHRKMMTAVKKGKGYKLQLSPEELEANQVDMEGGKINWRAVGRTIRRGAKAAAKFYKDEIKPEIGPGLKRVVKKVIETGLPALATAGLTAIGQPQLAAVAGPAAARLARRIAEPATDRFGKMTGAYGLKMGAGMESTLAAMEYPDIMPYKAMLQDNYSGFLGPNSPAMNPTLPMPDNSLPLVRDPHLKVYTKGRGMSIGGGLRLKSGMGAGDSFRMGLPMDPILPQHDNSLAI
jgi:hypothetical protein